MTSELPALPPRPPDGHKGTFGTVCVVGGQAAAPRVMLGGPAFSALAALRVGTGLAVLAVPEPLMAETLVIAPEATGLALPVDSSGALVPSETAALMDRYLPTFRCLAIGPGFGDGAPQQQIVLRLAAQDSVPLVIDADALNALAASRDFHRDLRAQSVLTPHPGEFKRLADALGISGDAADPDQRGALAARLAQRLGCVVVLKGHQTVISDGLETWTNSTGNVALATAGSGDVLTGVIAGLVAQFFRPSIGMGSMKIGAGKQEGLTLAACARWGVYLHGLAADRWAARHGNAGMLATDLLGELPDALSEVRGG